jgi:hypothetical protein
MNAMRAADSNRGDHSQRPIAQAAGPPIHRERASSLVVSLV